MLIFYGYKYPTKQTGSTTFSPQINIKINSIKKYLRKNKNKFAN